MNSLVNDTLPSGTLLQLLAILADGTAVTPEALADRVDMSPARLLAGIAQLADHGVRQRSDRSLRIPGGLELLDRVGIEARAAAFGAESKVEVRGVTGSTNDDVRAALAAGGRPPFAILAEAQQSGRGRRGRQWSSPVASNLYLTIAEGLPGGVEASRGLSLAIGVAVAEGIGRVTGLDVDLKWPNDILHGGRKLGGILVELAEAPSGSAAIIGIGLNVRVPDYVGREIDQAWTDLQRCTPAELSRNELAAALIDAVRRTLDHFRANGFDALLRSRWQARDPFFDRRIVATSGTVVLEGTERGIDEEGQLLIDTAGGLERIGAGEVSIRLAAST